MSTNATGASEDEMSEPDHSYESLGPRLASSTNLISAPSTVQVTTSPSYLHPQVSERWPNRHESKRSHCRQRRRHRRQSESSRETDELDYNFRKMKLWLCLLTCLLVVLVVAFLLTHPRIGPFFRQEIPDGLKLCVSCATLRNKAGSAGGLLDQLVSPEYPKYCCFRTVEQLLSLVEWYAHGYTQQEIKKVKDRYPVVNKYRYPSLEPSAAHMFVEVSSNGKLSFTEEGMGAIRSVHNPSGTQLTINEEGYYFVYSRLLFSTSDYFHRVIYEDVPGRREAFMQEKVDTKKPGRVASLLLGMRRLSAGSVLTLSHTGNAINGDGRENYFGLYKFAKV